MSYHFAYCFTEQLCYYADMQLEAVELLGDRFRGIIWERWRKESPPPVDAPALMRHYVHLMPPTFFTHPESLSEENKSQLLQVVGYMRERFEQMQDERGLIAELQAGLSGREMKRLVSLAQERLAVDPKYVAFRVKELPIFLPQNDPVDVRTLTYEGEDRSLLIKHMSREIATGITRNGWMKSPQVSDSSLRAMLITLGMGAFESRHEADQIVLSERQRVLQRQAELSFDPDLPRRHTMRLH